MLSVTPEVPGLQVRVRQFGDELEVVNRTGTEVVVPGYADEPYLRIGPEGVWRNAHSPATNINLDGFGRVDLPADADSAAEPEWVRNRGSMTGLLAVVLGWLLLVQGLPDVDVLWTAHVLSSGPQLPARIAGAVLVALGVGFVVGGIAGVRRFREAAHRGGADSAVPVG